jgi:hypothetical protein
MRCSLAVVLGLFAGASVGACDSETTSAPRDASVSDAGDAGAGDDGAPNLVGDALPPGCSPSAGNFDIPHNGCDDDNDGTIDNGDTACDDKLPVTGDASLFARAIDLCQTASGPSDPKWGVVSIEYKGSFSTGTPAQAEQHGILPKFGDVVRPRRGSSLGILSSGWAREYDNPAGSPANTPFKGGAQMQPATAQDDAPPGFPKKSGDCVVDSTVHDVIDVKIRIKVPTNALGLTFDFDFWSGECPDYVCTKYNDAFIAYLTSSAFNGGAADNISFDAQNDPVSVNNGFFDRCTPGSATGCGPGAVPKIATCAGGESELTGTGFYDRGAWCAGKVTTGGGATGWLTSTAPVTPGEIITIELILWDTGDQNYDSSVLLDNFGWQAAQTSTGTGRPPK